MKIPNSAALRDFFENKGGFYIPSGKDFTTEFARQVMSNEK